MATDNLSDKAIKAFKPLAAGGGMYLLVRTNGSKLWQMAYRFGGKQKTLSLGIYPEVSLEAARDKRDAAREQLANGTDPMAAKAERKLAQATAKTFSAWADEWLDKERREGRDERTMAGKERYAGYLKDESGKIQISAISRDAALAFLRKFEEKGKLETRDRVRSSGEQICSYADAEEKGVNLFSPFRRQAPPE
jgi:Arm DNA-binding domain/Phage integrase central domain